MTEFSWKAFEPKSSFMWCEKHQCRREVHFYGTAPSSVCPECKKEHPSEIDAEMDAATN